MCFNPTHSSGNRRLAHHIRPLAQATAVRMLTRHRSSAHTGASHCDDPVPQITNEEALRYDKNPGKLIGATYRCWRRR